MKIKLMPHKGVEIEGNFIGLGADVNSIIKNYVFDKYDNIYYLYDNNVHIETDRNKICEIMCFIDAESPIELLYEGQCISRLEVDTVLEMMNKSLKEDAVIVEDGHTYIWKNHDVCCGRDKTPNDIEEIICESKRDGVYEEMLEEISRDIEDSKYFTTICIGIQGSYKSISL